MFAIVGLGASGRSSPLRSSRMLSFFSGRVLKVAAEPNRPLEPKDFRAAPTQRKWTVLYGISMAFGWCCTAYQKFSGARTETVCSFARVRKTFTSLEKIGLLATCNPMGAGKWRGSNTPKRSVVADAS